MLQTEFNKPTTARALLTGPCPTGSVVEDQGRQETYLIVRPQSWLLASSLTSKRFMAALFLIPEVHVLGYLAKPSPHLILLVPGKFHQEPL